MYVFPSVTETYGNVVIEALASGLVVLAYDYAAAKENIVNGQNGYLAPYRKETEFLRRFDELIEARSEWKNISNNAQQSIKENTWENVVAKYEQSILALQRISNPSSNA